MNLVQEVASWAPTLYPCWAAQLHTKFAVAAAAVVVVLSFFVCLSHCIAHSVLELVISPLITSQVLGLYSCVTAPAEAHTFNTLDYFEIKCFKHFWNP